MDTMSVNQKKDIIKMTIYDLNKCKKKQMIIWKVDKKVLSP